MHVAFEWPRHCLGWTDDVVESVVGMLPIEVHFDGCMLDVKDETASLLLLKPWTVRTTLSTLQPLGQHRCDRSHPHGTTRGVAAYRSGFYTLALAQAIGNLVVGHDVGDVLVGENADFDAPEQSSCQPKPATEPFVQVELEEQEEQAQLAKTMSIPDLPSAEEVFLHRLTHLPYRR